MSIRDGVLRAVLLTFVFLACAVGAFAAGSTEATDGPEATELEVWSWGREPLIQAAADAYTALHPNVTITVSLFPWDDYWTKLAASVPSGTGPDLFWIHTDYAHQYESSGLLAPMPDDLFPQDFTSKFRSADTFGYVDGNRYLLPWSEQNNVLFYNTDMVREAGISISPDKPLTWDEFRDIAKRLTVTDSRGRVTRAGFHFMGVTRTLFSIMMLQRGMNWIDSTGTDVVWNSPEGVETAQFIKSFVDDGIASIDLPDYVEAFGSGLAATVPTSGWFKAAVIASYPDMKDKIGVAPLPTWDGSRLPAQTNGNQLVSLAVPSGLDESTTRAAFEFVKFTLSDNDVMHQWLSIESQVPSRTDLPELFPDLLDNEVVKVMDGQADYSVGDVIPGWFRNVADRYIEDGLLLAGMSPEEALARFEAEAREMMREEPLAPWDYGLHFYAHSDMMK